jgi:thiol:disulfide interchange protein DsbG
MKVAFLLPLAVLMLTGYCRSAPADSPTATAPPALTLTMADQLVSGASSGQYRAVRVFRGPHGLTGVVVQSGDRGSSTSVLWISPDGAAVIAGTLFDARANDLNQLALVELGYRYRPSESLRRASASQALPVMWGAAGPVLTAFIDANCSYCHLLYQQLTPYVSDRRIRVRFVMVGVIKADSVDRAIAILSFSSPLAALKRDQDDFNAAAEEGGFPATGISRSPAAVAAVTANNALMSKAGIDGTPAFLYCSKSSGDVQQIVGLPRELPQLLADLSSGPARECAG